MKESKDILAMNLKSATRDLIKYWYVLLLFTGFMVALTFLYQKYTTKNFAIKSSIVIQSENNRNMGGGTNDLMSAFNFMVQDKSFNNELFYLQSLPLLMDVVDQMDLKVSYYVQDSKIPKRFNFGLENVYNNSPIIIIPEAGNSQPINVLFYVDILNENRFFISGVGENVDLVDFNTNRISGRAESFELVGIYDFGATVSNEHSSFRVLLNAGYTPGAYINKNLFFQFNWINQYVWNFKNGLAVTAQGNESTLAHLELSIDNRQLGIDFMNNLIETYIQRNMDESNLLANKTIEHIESQLDDISGDLTLSEQQLQNLRLNRNVMDIEDKSRNIYQQQQNFEIRRDEAQRRLNHLRQMEDYFIQYKDSTRILAPSALGLNDNVLNTLINELTTLNAEKSRIISQDQMRNPRLATINIRIDNLKDVISENINFSIVTTSSELNDLNARINSLNREFSILPGTQRELLDIERRFKLNDAVYTSLLERRIHAQIIKASKLPDAKVIEPPRGGVAGPGSAVLYILSLLVGLGLPSAVIIGIKLAVNHLTSKDDVKLITNISIIGSIPTSTSNDKLIINDPQSVIAESFYRLRSNLVYYLHGESKKVILVTSSIPGEGKSFTSLNLAASFALANSKTILVEFDLRKPSEVMNGMNSNTAIPGVSSFLINRATLDEVIIKTDANNLDIIPSGQIPPNPISLISGQRTHYLIDELKKRYDYVIIDTPPYGLLTDSFVLMKHADVNVYVTRLNYTKKNVLASNMEEIEAKGIDNIYLIVNGEKNEMFSYGYGKYPYLKKEKSNIKFLSNKKKT